MSIIGIIFFVIIIVSIVIPVANGSLHFLTVLSGSMRPSIQPGDIVVSSSIQPESIRIDDVITFRLQDQSQKRSVTHRVVGITTENGTLYFQTKGDANEERDIQPVPAENVVGKVVLTIPLLGYLVNFAQSLLGFILFIMIPATILIIGEIRNIYRISKDDSDGIEPKSEKPSK